MSMDIDKMIEERLAQSQPAAPSGGNGAPAPEQAITPPALTPPIVAPEEIAPPLRGRRKETATAPGKAAAAKVLPDPWRIVIRKIGPSAQEHYIGDYRAAQINAAGGDVESFIRSQLVDYIEPGVNRFRVYLRDPKGTESPYGEVSVMGQPRQELSQLEIIERIERIRREAEERAKREAEEHARREIERLQSERVEMLERLRKLEEAKSPLEAFLLMQAMQPPQPRIDPSEIARQVAEAVRSALPPPSPPPPPVDPLDSVVRLLSLMQQSRQEQLSLKDLLGLLPTVRESLGLSKLEEEYRRLRERLEEASSGGRISDLLDEIRALKEAAEMLGGGASSGLDALLTPDGIMGIAELFKAVNQPAASQQPAPQQALPAPQQPKPAAMPSVHELFAGALEVPDIDASALADAASAKDHTRTAGALAIALQQLAKATPKWRGISVLAMRAAKRGDAGWLSEAIAQTAARLSNAGKLTPADAGWIASESAAIAHAIIEFARRRAAG